MDPSPTGANRSADDGNNRRPRRKRQPKEELLRVDPLFPFSLSTDDRFHRICEKLAPDHFICDPLVRMIDRLKERIAITTAVSDACLRYISPSRAQNFVTNRKELLYDLFKDNSLCLHELADRDVVDLTVYDKLYPHVQEFQSLVSRELDTIVECQVMLEFGILSYPAPARIGQAYLATLTDFLAQPSDLSKLAEFFHQIGQKYFCGLIQNMYNPAKDTPGYDAPVEAEELDMQWCPVTRAWHERSSTAVIQFLPWPFEEPGIRYIYQVPPENGWKVVHGFGNGMAVLSSIKDHLDQNRMVIVPDAGWIHGRKLIVLDDALLDQCSYLHGPRFGELHQNNLIFKTPARPHADNLYFKCLVTLARRRRCCQNDPVEHARLDLKKVPMHQFWKTSFQRQRQWMIDLFGFEPADFEWVMTKACDKVEGMEIEGVDVKVGHPSYSALTSFCRVGWR